MAYKILAIDMDDTLLNDQREISQANQAALAAAQDKGVKVIISTGRMYSSVGPYLKQLNLTGPTITYNGALVKEAANDKTLYHHSISQADALKVIEVVKQKDLHLNLYLNDQLYVNKLESEAKYYQEIAGVKAHLIKRDLESFLKSKQTTTKAVIVEQDLAKAENLLAEFKSMFKEKLNVFTSKSPFIEFTCQGVSKGSALKQLAKDLAVKQEEIIAIGDSYNDLEMIDYAGLGVAVANAREELKERADYITSTNNQSGVAKVIEKYII